MVDYKARGTYGGTRGKWKKGESASKERSSRVRGMEVPLQEAQSWLQSSKLALNPHRWYHMLYYGDTGNGKSFMAATAPRALIMAVDQHGNWAFRESERQRLQDAFPRTRLEFDAVSIRSFQDVWRVYKVLEHACETGEWPGGRAYWTWVIDGFGELQSICMDEVTTETQHDAPEMYDYKLVGADFRRLILRFMRLPMHGIITVNEKNAGDSEHPHWVPQLTGQLSEQLPTHMDVVGRLIIDRDGERVVLTQPGHNYVAKDLTGRLERSESPNIQLHFERLMGKTWFKQMVDARRSAKNGAFQRDPEEAPVEQSPTERAGDELAQRLASPPKKKPQPQPDDGPEQATAIVGDIVDPPNNEEIPF